jgi:hypothetical protein
MEAQGDQQGDDPVEVVFSALSEYLDNSRDRLYQVSTSSALFGNELDRGDLNQEALDGHGRKCWAHCCIYRQAAQREGHAYDLSIHDISPVLTGV